MLAMWMFFWDPADWGGGIITTGSVGQEFYRIPDHTAQFRA